MAKESGSDKGRLAEFKEAKRKTQGYETRFDAVRQTLDKGMQKRDDDTSKLKSRRMAQH